MNFISLEYWLFFAASFGVYYLLKGTKQLGWIVACSALFYSIYKPEYLLILLAQLGIDYAAGLQIERSQTNKKGWLLASIISNLVFLITFKYTKWLLGLGGLQLGWDDAIPLGLSFHTFQGIAYTTDVYRGHFKAEANFLKFAQYIFFFPQLVAGPIERPGHFIPQIKNKPFLANNFVVGARLILWGLVQKMVVADRLALFADPVFAQRVPFTAAATLVGLLAFTFQILADFSGYTDIARGCARMLGYNLVENFNNPYGATSLADFWRRWHISLSTWFRDYVYQPLGGNRQALVGWMGAILVVFGLSGLWHGAQTTFLVWGLFHGSSIILERVTKAPKSVTRFTTFPLVVVGWVFFRAADMEGVRVLFSSLVGTYSWTDVRFLQEAFVSSGNIMLAIVFAALFQLVVSTKAYWQNVLAQHGWLRWGSYYIAIVLLLFLAPLANPAFIYFQF